MGPDVVAELDGGTMRTCAFVTLVSVMTAASGFAGQPTAPILLDRDITVNSGATIASSVGEAIARAEEVLVPNRLFTERGVGRRTANVAYRWLKLLYFDLPQEQWLMVANHEVFGHGGRLRERFDGPISYEIDAPVPYGHGGGSTFFEFDREPTPSELLAVSAAGMEANQVAARLTAQRVLRQGRLGWRDAARYLGFELDTFGYIWSTSDDLEEPGHDVSDFVRTFNEVAAETGANELTARTLKRDALASLANPMLGYAVYSIGRYLWSGATSVGVPMVPIGGVKYLPMLRYQFAPYGTEWSVMNELAASRGSTEVEVRFGRALGVRPWGVGVQRTPLANLRGWQVAAGVDMWRQPAIVGQSGDSLRSARVGAAVRAQVERAIAPVWFSSSRMTAILEVVVKSGGFIPGEPLRSGVVVRGGVGLPFAR